MGETDLISRQAAIEAIDALHDKPNAWLEYAVDAIKHLPSAHPVDKDIHVPCTDTISRQAAIDAVHEEFDDCLVWDESGQRTADEFEIIIDRLPSAQPDRGYIEQIKWERDLAIRQLADLGYGLGEKPRTNGDIISRQAAIATIEHYLKHPPKNHSQLFIQGMDDAYYRTLSILRALPSAQPEETCDTCKYGYFVDGMCDYCRVRFQSNYERRTDEQTISE